MHLNNMVSSATGGTKTLATYRIEKDADGRYPDPFGWPCLSLCPDRGPDNVCMVSFLESIGLNVQADFDIEHDGHNSGKSALKEVGLYK